MIAVVILAALLVGLFAFDMAALRWGVDSSEDFARPDAEWQRCWRGVNGD